MREQDVQSLSIAVGALPAVEYPRGWRGQIEASLIDAVLSIRAVYGTESTGVRAAIQRYRDSVIAPLDDLERLARTDTDQLAQLLNRQVTGGVRKVDAIGEAARNLVTVGVRHAADLDPAIGAHRRAYTSARGLGWVTWNYLLMNLGHPRVKPDTWITRWVGATVGRSVTPDEAGEMVMASAAALGRDPIDVDHTIWFYARRRHES